MNTASSGYSLNNGSGGFTTYDSQGTGSGDPLMATNVIGFGHTMGAFDINRDGRVDLLGQMWGGTFANFPERVDDLSVSFSGSGGQSPIDGNQLTNRVLTTDILRFNSNNSSTNFQAGKQTMNIADFNGDGILDLFLGQTTAGGVNSMVYSGGGSAGAGNGSFSVGATLSTQHADRRRDGEHGLERGRQARRVRIRRQRIEQRHTRHHYQL